VARHKTFDEEEEREDDGTGTKDQPVDVDSHAILREDNDDVVEMSKIPVAQLAEEMEDVEAAKDQSDSDESVAFQTQRFPASRKKGKQPEKQVPVVEEQDDKKKLGFRTTYDGFRIHGRILCLVVKRKGIVKGKVLEGGAGQAMMEEWISSTQAAEGRMTED
jgi:hypothetical protein